ncbi:aerobic-type carbon monoxide dehydrogenase, large subunit CoxL/CutL-like protein [Rivularia sp. PCC 7116]|uniref:xanthine dehydrogenase family protein molybdopterin-binding subunit n=1 Tax=Rivularia sp. PCC 7116 TaxID=373994 RepID=UPI00029F4607|nr:xanthine dehydrogenase family protein molybdopterin-binding subunit [Rivularia sp. PCC 7116]AFY58826.1 aerobic-type carbon monoxide dehydrogenase, large subunit CoxL/CutL-like protein [Rivularia sp. PCC 7116]
MNNPIGKPLNRIDGRLKVTGKALYAAEYPVQNMSHAVVIESKIAKGSIRNIDISPAEKLPGVLAVITYQNAPKLGQNNSNQSGGNPLVKPLPVLQDNKISFYGQHIGVVVAETLEQAEYAANLVKVTYLPETPAVSFEKNLKNAYKPERLLVPLEPDSGRGDINKGLQAAQVQLDENYSAPIEHHNPMEPSATTAVWQGSKLTLYDASQHVGGTQKAVADTFGIPQENVQVIARFIGGGFGCKFPIREHVILAALAARQVKRPVKLALSREQMFTSVGCRPYSSQRIRLGATKDGKLTAVAHEIVTQTNMDREFVEHVGGATNMIYNAPNVLVTHRAVPLNMVVPTIMRAPGETPGMYALESAIDELAYKLNIDPIELRIINDPPQDPYKNLPWSSRSLVESLREGAKRFGWEKRNSKPASMRDGGYLVGYGVAAATYPTNRQPASARAQIQPNGNLLVQIAATDIGTGTYTILAQVAAEVLQLPLSKVAVEIGDSELPPSPGSGGSWGAASYGSAVHDACMALKDKMVSLVKQDNRSALKNLKAAELEVKDGGVFAKDKSVGENFGEILSRNKLKEVSVQVESTPDEARKKYSMHSFGAHFAEVKVDPNNGMVKVSRFLGAFGVGKILNQKTARSQMIGGIVWGISQALHEKTILDDRYGNFVNHNLAEYHIPVNADIPDIEIVFIEENDPHVNPLGVKGVGEIGIVGAGAAVANAIYHATGKRIRDLPITPDKLL